MKYTKEELQAMLDCNDKLVRQKQGEILKLNRESDGYRKLMADVLEKELPCKRGDKIRIGWKSNHRVFGRDDDEMNYLECYYAGIRCERSATRMILYECNKDSSKSMVKYPDYVIPELKQIEGIEVLSIEQSMANEKLGGCVLAKCAFNNNYKCRYAASTGAEVVQIPCVRYVEIEIEKKINL